jgi:glycerophosphoryl diester phosphodiesterase
MTTAQHERLTNRLLDLAHARRPIIAALLTMLLVLAIILNPITTDGHASGMFSSLRAPGEPGFVAGHRGDKEGAPENTIPALKLAIESEAEFVETDLQLTSDGVPVLMHDWTVDRTTDGTGPVWSLTYDEISRLDAGGWYAREFTGTRVPTLTDFIDVFTPSTKHAILELKGSWTADQARIVTSQLFEAGVQERVVFASFDLMTLKALQQVANSVPRVIISRKVVGDPAILAAACGASAIVTSHAFIESDPEAVDRIHAAGLGVLLYTLNNEDDWTAAVSLGVDGIITDKPATLDAWLANADPGDATALHD